MKNVVYVIVVAASMLFWNNDSSLADPADAIFKGRKSISLFVDAAKKRQPITKIVEEKYNGDDFVEELVTFALKEGNYAQAYILAYGYGFVLQFNPTSPLEMLVSIHPKGAIALAVKTSAKGYWNLAVKLWN